MNIAERKTLVTREFKQRFGGVPILWSRAPGRVDLMGSHTDYNEGYVLTMSINRDTWLAVAPRTDDLINIYSMNVDAAASINLNDLAFDTEDRWTNYIRGVAKMLRADGYALTGFNGIIHSTIPFSSGLSSSAALEVSTAIAFQLLGDYEIDPVQTALLCQRAENEFVGVNSGILDQYSSAMGEAGRALVLDCRHLTSETAHIPADLAVVICDTRAERQLAGTEYDDRRSQCEAGAAYLAAKLAGVKTLRDVSPEQFAAHKAALSDVVAKRCRFIIEENRRVLDLARALSGNDLAAIKTLTAQSYLGARDLYEIGAPAMEAMMKAMRGKPGPDSAGVWLPLFSGRRLATLSRTSKPFTGRKPAFSPVCTLSARLPVRGGFCRMNKPLLRSRAE